MGRAIARRLGSGRTLLLADRQEDALAGAARELAGEGHDVRTRPLDVSDPDAVAALAAGAAALGPVVHLVHTAGLSPVQASAEAIVAVDLLGTAYVLEELGPVLRPGAAAVVIASMAGHMAPPIPPEDEAALARTPARELAGLPCLGPVRAGDPGLAYAFAKRANQLRVRAASVAWGRRGTRVNSVSPGVVATAMGRAELEGPVGEVMRSMVEGSGTQRLGTPDDIAAAVEFLLGQGASFVTGADLLVDGGVVASLLGGA